MSCSDFIVGVDLGITSPDALRNLQSSGANVRVFQEPGRLFHPKAVYLKTHDAEHLIVGSNNLTSAGISSNHELAIWSRRNNATDEAFTAFLNHFDFLKAHAACSLPDDRFFENYEQSRFREDLAFALSKHLVPIQQAETRSATSIDPSHGETLGRYPVLLYKEFPQVDRRKGQKRKNDPLIVLNN